MSKEDLIKYEMPTIAEFIFWKWGQYIIGRYIAWKINRKWKRYEIRLKRAAYFAKITNNQ